MTSKEAIQKLYEERADAYDDKVHSKGLGWKEAIDHYDNIGRCLTTIEKDLDLLDLYKKFFNYSLTEIQGIKYLTLPNNSDIRMPDSLLKITDEEYELLKEGLER